MFDLRLAFILRARKDVNVHSLSAQLTTKVANIDIHSACFLAAQKGQGAGMDTKHGNT